MWHYYPLEKIWHVSHLTPYLTWWECPSYLYGVTWCFILFCILIIYRLTKYLLISPDKDAIISRLKKFNHFRRGRLNDSLLILRYNTTVWLWCIGIVIVSIILIFYNSVQMSIHLIFNRTHPYFAATHHFRLSFRYLRSKGIFEWMNC